MWASTMKYFSPSFSYTVGPPDSRNEDRPAAHAAGVEVVEGVHGLVQRVFLGVQGDLAGLGEHHELGQIGVAADDVPDDVALAGDDVQRRDAQLAAVADHVVGAVGGGHVPAVHLGALLGDVV